MELAQTLACSMILPRINYCNAVFHSTPTGTIQKLQQVQNNAARIVKAIPRQAITAPAALVASPAADHIQAGSSDVQSLEHVHSGLPERLNHGTCL